MSDVAILKKDIKNRHKRYIACDAETQQIYSLPPLATREFAHIKFFKNQSLLPKQ